MRAPSLCENAIRIDRGDSCASHQSEKMIADRKKYWIGGYKECSNAKLAKTCKRRRRILPERQRKLVVESCQDAYNGKMPGRSARCCTLKHSSQPRTSKRICPTVLQAAANAADRR